MKALSFWKSVTMDKANLLEGVLTSLRDNHIRFCVIGGQAVNAYVEPLVSLDLDLAVAVDQIGQVRAAMQQSFQVEEFPHSLNVSSPGSDLRIQIQTDPRYSDFVNRATDRDVLGVRLPVAALEDVLQGKVWAASAPERRPTKRRKDLLDIARILEANSRLESRVPAALLKEIS
ncbi:MAG TPA: nucleotidyl transferase AbiEii/AbiGii toxin family protein [Bryobacteraceae bacterium]|nr:nucleotidyl transferase AbiEii/AbiGii toxin family protein [Bryobacteraceae bacterium]